VFLIRKSWSEEDRAVIDAFLRHAKALLVTKEFKVSPTPKNKAFQNKYLLRSEDQVALLRALTVEDCIEFGPNNNPRYPDSTVFKFIKDADLFYFGEPETVSVYIKEYIVDEGRFEVICVISLHEEGLHD